MPEGVDVKDGRFAPELHIGIPMDVTHAWSVLYALLEGVTALDIACDDVDGTLHAIGGAKPPALAIFDRVPGGAGHAQRIAGNLAALFRSGLARVETCECGPETSCYNCLRNYTNQVHHEVLSRGAAADVLRRALAGQTAAVPDAFSPRTAGPSLSS